MVARVKCSLAVANVICLIVEELPSSPKIVAATFHFILLLACVRIVKLLALELEYLYV